jgi:hypothetical protein
MHHVVLATDGSEGSLHAAQVLGDLVGPLPDVSVTIVYVAHVPHSFQLADESGHRVTPDVPLDIMIRHTADPIRTRMIPSSAAHGPLPGFGGSLTALPKAESI